MDLRLDRPVVPPETKKNVKIGVDPETGKKVFIWTPEDVAAELRWKVEAKGEIQKGQINTDKANEAFERLKKWAE